MRKKYKKAVEDAAAHLKEAGADPVVVIAGDKLTDVYTLVSGDRLIVMHLIGSLIKNLSKDILSQSSKM